MLLCAGDTESYKQEIGCSTQRGLLWQLKKKKKKKEERNNDNVNTFFKNVSNTCRQKYETTNALVV